MKLYCICAHCTSKVILQTKSTTRQHLATQIGETFNFTCCNCKTTLLGSTKIVYAESSNKNAPVSGTLSGMAIGALFGPLGSIIGGIAGAASGARIRNSDKTAVNTFNNS